MENKQQSGEIRRQIVRDFVKQITNDILRKTCFLYMRGYGDEAVRNTLKIDELCLHLIKTQLAFDLIKAGIRFQEC